MMQTKEKNFRKMLLVLPLLIIPFLALAFYGMGGGKRVAPGEKPVAGINTELPDAQFKKEDPRDKLSLYALMAKDSSAFKKQFGEGAIPAKPDVPVITAGSGTAPEEEKIQQKLNLIRKEISRPVRKTQMLSVASEPPKQLTMNRDVDRLEQLMHTMQEDKEADPEMQQLSEMLDKIIRIQNPETATQKPVVTVKVSADSQFRAIPAEVARKQKVMQGGTVELRLLDTVTLGGYLIPKGYSLFGTCRITNQRLLLEIRNIRLGTSIIPVNLTVYSPDGMPGINAPEAILSETSGIAADNAVRSIGSYGLNESLATQVAGAGIDAAKDLVSKKVRKVKVKLHAGEPVLLRNNQKGSI